MNPQTAWADPAVIIAIGTQAALVVGAIFAGAARVVRALKDVKTTAQSAAMNSAVAVDRAQTADLKLDQIHDKADYAIAQNEKLDKQTDGNFSKMLQQLAAAETENKALQQQIVALTAMLTAKVVAPSPASSSAAGGRRADDLSKGTPP